MHAGADNLYQGQEPFQSGLLVGAPVLFFFFLGKNALRLGFRISLGEGAELVLLARVAQDGRADVLLLGVAQHALQRSRTASLLHVCKLHQTAQHTHDALPGTRVTLDSADASPPACLTCHA